MEYRGRLSPSDLEGRESPPDDDGRWSPPSDDDQPPDVPAPSPGYFVPPDVPTLTPSYLTPLCNYRSCCHIPELPRQSVNFDINISYPSTSSLSSTSLSPPPGWKEEWPSRLTGLEMFERKERGTPINVEKHGLIREPVYFRPVPPGAFARPSLLEYIDRLDELLGNIHYTVTSCEGHEDKPEALMKCLEAAKDIRVIYNHCIIGSSTDFYAQITYIIDTIKTSRSANWAQVDSAITSVVNATNHLQQYIDHWKTEISLGNMSIDEQVDQEELSRFQDRF